MAATIAEVLGYTALLEAIENIKRGIPWPFPDSFMNITEPVLGNTGRFIQTPGTRQTSRLSAYGAAAHKRALVDIGKRDVMLIHSFEEITLDPITLQNLMQYENYQVQQMGMQEVARQVLNFTELFINLRKAITQQVLLNATIYFDANGNLLPDSSGAAETVTFNRNANNANQLNGIISASWANFNTDIPKQLIALDAQAAQDHGYELKYAFYGKNIRGYLSQNNYVLDYLARDPLMNSKMNTSKTIPDGLFGYTWIPVYTSFWQDTNGTNHAIWGDDNVVFTPEPDRRWYTMMEGSYPVPTNINIADSAESAIQGLRQVYGMFGFSQVITNPVTVGSFMGDTFLPCLKQPDVTYAADVTP